VDRTGNRLSIAGRQLAKVAKGTKGCGKCFSCCVRYYIYIGHVVPVRKDEAKADN
jgi:hypothetical protein